MTVRLWLVWSLPAVLAVQVVLLLIDSGPDSHWRGSGHTAAWAVVSLSSTAAALWSLWGLRRWPVALRVFVIVLHVPLLVAALLMAGF